MLKRKNNEHFNHEELSEWLMTPIDVIIEIKAKYPTDRESQAEALNI
jgi:hypothetical protein